MASLKSRAAKALASLSTKCVKVFINVRASSEKSLFPENSAAMDTSPADSAPERAATEPPPGVGCLAASSSRNSSMVNFCSIPIPP